MGHLLARDFIHRSCHVQVNDTEHWLDLIQPYQIGFSHFIDHYCQRHDQSPEALASILMNFNDQDGRSFVWLSGLFIIHLLNPKRQNQTDHHLRTLRHWFEVI